MQEPIGEAEIDGGSAPSDRITTPLVIFQFVIYTHVGSVTPATLTRYIFSSVQ